MKNYTVTSPSLDGVISNDPLFFEGIQRPTIISMIKDSPNIPKGNIDLLEKYFNDIYNLFLKKLSTYTMTEKPDDQEALKLQALLQEIIKVKSLLVYNS